jgi:hypothetical protein
MLLGESNKLKGGTALRHVLTAWELLAKENDELGVEFPPLSEKEINALPPSLKQMLARHAVQVSGNLLTKILGITDEIRKADGHGR